jgi:hypothetical protein
LCHVIPIISSCCSKNIGPFLQKQKTNAYSLSFPLPFDCRTQINLHHIPPIWFSISIHLHHIPPSPIHCRTQINLSRWCFSGGGLTGQVSIFPPTSIYPNLNFKLGFRIYKLGMMVDYQSLVMLLIYFLGKKVYASR